MKTIKEFKEEQKSGAVEIRRLRLKMKDAQRGKISWAREYDQWEVYKKSQEWRHRHIAYCMLRGKEYAQIEPKVRDGNEPDMVVVERIMSNYSPPEVHDAESNGRKAEAVCTGEA